MISEVEVRKKVEDVKKNCEVLEYSLRKSQEDYKLVQEAQEEAGQISEKVKACGDELKAKEDELKQKKDRIEQLKKFAASSSSGPSGSSEAEEGVKNLATKLESGKKALAELEKGIEAAQKKAEENARILKSLGRNFGKREADVGLKLSALASSHVLAGRFKVDNIDHNSPLISTGVQAGDILMAVDGDDVCGQSLTAVEGSLKGREGSSVHLEFYRANGSSFMRLPFTVHRNT